MKTARALLPSPDFSNDPGNYIAGLRPYRTTGYRLERLTVQGKTIVHNYGHGGAGITMSWGCAEKVLDLVVEAGVLPKTPVAVLGAGVMGLTAATRLVEAGYAPTVYARAETRPITSMVAGGQWAPSIVKRRPGSAGLVEFEDILRKAFAAHERRIGLGFGVSRRDNYVIDRSPAFDIVPRDVIPEPDQLAHLPFERLNVPGYCYKTLLIEPPIFMPKLRLDLVANGVSFVEREFKNAAEVQSLAQTVVINCTGLGSKQIWPDADLVSRKGQLAILPPQPNLDYLFSKKGYLFPRSDGVVIGGTNTNSNDPTADPADCRGLVVTMERIFDGNIPTTLLGLPDGYLLDK